MLCEVCAHIDWDHVLGGTLTKHAKETFSMRHMYNLDGSGGTGESFVSGPIPSIAKMGEVATPCQLCKLWLRAYQRAYPDVDPAKDGRGHKDSWFTYYVGSSGHFQEWQGNPRGIDDDARSRSTRQKALKSVRLRFRSYETNEDFEQLLELTCLDSDLPLEHQSRGGRLLPDECARGGLFMDWLEMCQNDHGESCQGLLPAAVLSETESVMKLRLIDVEKLHVIVCSFKHRYCALSYVWGGIESFRADPMLFEPDPERPDELFLDLRRFIPESENGLVSSRDTSSQVVPRTVLDAIEVTRALGERFLWVDAICMLQKAEEMAAAIPNMDAIYKTAIVTIVAAAGKNSSVGLPRAHPNAPQLHQVCERVDNRTFMLAQPSLNLVLKDSTWSSRGWTFQEDKLSPRQLIFTDYGIYFRCQQDTWAEDSIEKISAISLAKLSDRPRTLYYIARDTPQAREEARFADYTYDVRLYTTRILGRTEDALNAFNGLISEIKRTTMAGEFHWGLPERCFDAALLWKCVDLWNYDLWVFRPPKDPVSFYDASQQDIDSAKERQLADASRGFSLPPWEEQKFPLVERRNNFPSWSWCGWKGQLGYFPRKVASPDLCLLQSIESSVRWP